MGTQDDVVTITESTIMEGTHKDLLFMSSINVAATPASTDNVDWFMEDVECTKDKLLKLKDNMVNI